MQYYTTRNVRWQGIGTGSETLYPCIFSMEGGFTCTFLVWYLLDGIIVWEENKKKNGNVNTCFYVVKYQLTLLVYRYTTDFAQSFLVLHQIAAVNITAKFNFRGYIIYMYLIILIEL